MMDYYLIKNDAGRVCDPKKGGCGKVHEYWTRGCRPVVFTDPSRYSFFRIAVETEKGITLKADEITYSVNPSIGTAVKVSEKDLKGMNFIQAPPPEEVEKLQVSVSYPGNPVRRGGLVIPNPTVRNVKYTLGDEKWR